MTFKDIITRKTNRLVNRKFTPLWLFVSGAALEACGSSSGGGDVTEIVIAIPNVQDNLKNGPEGLTPDFVLFTPMLTDSSVDGVTFEIDSQTDINGNIVDIFEINSDGAVIVTHSVVFDYENPEGISETDFSGLGSKLERDNANTYKVDVVAKVDAEAGELTSKPVRYTFVITDEPDVAVLSTMSNVKPTGTDSVSPPSAGDTSGFEIPIADFLKAFVDQDTDSANQVTQLSFSVIPEGVTLQYKAADETLSLIIIDEAFGIEAGSAIVATIDENVAVGEVVLAYSGSETGGIAITGASLSFSVNNAPNIGSVTDAANEVVTDGAIEILENTADDIAIFKIAVSDIDAGQALSYSLEGADAGLFNVEKDNSGGALITFRSAVGDDGAFSPDFETPGSSDDDNIYSITFVVIDALDASDNLDLEVTILDQDEAATDIMLSSEAIVEDETATQIGGNDVYLVGTLSVTDPDGADSGFTVNALSLAADELDGGSFVIDDNKLYLKHKPDFETKSSYSVTIIANAGTATVYETAAITITVGDVDEAPTLSDSVSLGDVKKGDADTDGEDLTISKLLDYADYLDQDAGDYISKIEITSISAVVSNTDSTAVVIAVGDLTLSYTDGDVSTGTPTLGTPVDFSIDIPIDPSDDIVDGSINIKIADGVDDGTLFTVVYKVYDSQGLASDEASLTFTATSVAINFDAPDIVSVPENSAADTLVATVSATVVGSTDYDTISYSLTGENRNLFEIDSDGRITLTGALDYETPAQHSVSVKATAMHTSGATVTSTTIVVLGVTDADDLAIVTVDDASGTNVDITNSVASVSVAENTLAVATLSGSDEDANQEVRFEIKDGGDGALFEITADGNLNFIRPPDFETPGSSASNNDYTVTVTAYSYSTYDDGTGVIGRIASSEVDTIVNIQVTDDGSLAADEAIVFSPTADVSLDENSATGASVATVSATAADGYAISSYELVGDGSELFAIDVGGMITLAGALNFEDATKYSLGVIATGTHSTEADATSSTSVTVNVNDVDEAPTDIKIAGESDAGIGIIVENKEADQIDGNDVYLVGEITVTDPDVNSAGINFAVNTPSLDSTSEADFVIDDNKLYLKHKPDFEGLINSYSVTIIATGSGVAAPSYTETITITVGDADDLAVVTVDDASGANVDITNSVASVSVAENTLAVATLSASDEDATQSVKFKIATDTDGVTALLDGRFFEIAETTGVLSFTSALDFEALSVPANGNTDGIYSVTVTAYSVDDSDGTTQVPDSEVLTTVNVQVADVDEAATDITLDSNEIVENKEVEANQVDIDGTPTTVYLVGTLSVTDPDVNPDFSANALTLGGTDASKFVIADNKLYLLESPNYEATPVDGYSITIIANAGAATVYQTDAITITVGDVDEAPVISTGAVDIGDVKTGDTATDGKTLTFSEIAGILSNNAGYSDEDAGDNLDNLSKIEITGISAAVSAVDPTAVDINANDFVLTYISGTSSVDKIIEGSTFVSTTPVAFGTDGTSGKFDGSINVKIADTVTDDTVYTVKYKIYDSGGLASADEGTLTFTAASVAVRVDAVPPVTLEENSGAGTIATLNHSVDGSTVYDTYSYSITVSGENNGRFTINDGGEIALTAAGLDYEVNDKEYFISVEVTASDAAGLLSVISSFTTVRVLVEDVDEAPTDITLDSNEIVENKEADQIDGNDVYFVGEITVTDPDGADSGFTVNVLTLAADELDGGSFVIDGNKLYLKESPDYETKSSYSVEITATGSGDAAPSYTETIDITVAPVDDNLLVDDGFAAAFGVSGTDPSYQIAEGNTEIGTFSGSDADSDQEVRFEIATDEDDIALLNGNFFEIDATTGVLSFASEPNFEAIDAPADNIYSVTVTAYSVYVDDDDDPSNNVKVEGSIGEVDGIVNELHNTINIEVTDVDESASTSFSYADDKPAVNPITNPAEIAENVDEQILYKFSGTDEDEGQTVGFDIINGIGDAGLFEIIEGDAAGDDAGKWLLSFKEAPDFETPLDANDPFSFDPDPSGFNADGNNIYSVRVKSFSVDEISGNPVDGSEAEATLYVKVTPVEDNLEILPTLFFKHQDIVHDAVNNIFQIAENTNNIGTFSASADADADQEVRFEIKAGDDATLFTVTEDGVLSFTSVPDFEALSVPANGNTDGIYSVTVTAYSYSTYDDGTGSEIGRIADSDRDSQVINIQVLDVDEDSAFQKQHGSQIETSELELDAYEGLSLDAEDTPYFAPIDSFGE